MNNQNNLQQTKFVYEQAFSRNLGFLTREELQFLRTKKIAIAGLGGVGGSHLLTLTRLGIGNFNLAEFDIFEIQNFNRQAGANINTINSPKIDVMAAQAKAINPELNLTLFKEGVNSSNIASFFEGVDLYVDSLDFFVFETRRMVLGYCYQNKIPVTMVAPIGMGAALVNFLPGKMSFADYVQLKPGLTDLQSAIRFLVALSPSAPQKNSLVDSQFVDFSAQKGPSTPMGVELCAGVAGTEVLKILLKRGPVSAAPTSIHYDAYSNRLCKKWTPFGNRNPIQRLKIKIAEKKFSKNNHKAPSS